MTSTCASGEGGSGAALAESGGGVDAMGEGSGSVDVSDPALAFSAGLGVPPPQAASPSAGTAPARTHSSRKFPVFLCMADSFAVGRAECASRHLFFEKSCTATTPEPLLATTSSLYWSGYAMTGHMGLGDAPMAGVLLWVRSWPASVM